MSDPDPRVERAYRSLAREEPPASLDDAILAASRRALTRASAARRWGVPVSVAALLVLAIGVTLEMQHEEPGVEVSAPGERTAVATPASPAARAEPQAESGAGPQAQVAPNPRPPQPSASIAQPHAQVPSSTQPTQPSASNAQPQARLEAKAKSRAQSRAGGKAQPQSPPKAQTQMRGDLMLEAPAKASEAKPEAEAPAVREEARLPSLTTNMAKRSAASGATADTLAADPHAALEKIAKLRAEGRDAEADRALEEFRKRFPDYRIDDATWERVKPR